MAILDEIQASIRQLAENAGASVVGVGQQWGAGSGIVLGAGQVLTNAHNVRGDRLMVTFAGGHTAEGSVTGHDIDADLAVSRHRRGPSAAVGRQRVRGDRDAGVHAGQPGRARAASDVRLGFRH